MRIFFTILLIFLLFYFPTLSQIPTVQDCGGAIPICQNSYSTTNSYSGTGNIPNEIDSLTSCTDGEINDVWYTFTAQTTGNFSFILTPNNTSGFGDDYDWSVYNLTNAQCSDIFANPNLEISYNSWGDYSGFNGQTGASSAMGGYGNHNGPGTFNGPEFNADIPVVAGGTYVMMVSNWSGSQYGYNINFSSSTAQIFDNVPPQIHQINSAISCGTTSITFNFSENILCSTIAPCDLTLTGPGGPYTITAISGANCSAGGTEEKTFTINFNPPIFSAGNFNLNLVASTCNSVTDLCGNIAPSGSLPFSVNLLNTNTSTTAATCIASNGSATVSVVGGSGNYTYLWNSIPPQITATASNLASGSYIVTVHDGSCIGIDTAVVGSSSNLSATITNVVNETCGMSNGSATVNVNGGTTPFNYQWNTIPPQTTQTATNLIAGNYSVTVTDVNACSASLNVIITVSGGPAASITATNAHCNQPDGSANATATGGSGHYSFTWNNGDTTSSINNLIPGVYSVTVNDGYCNSAATVSITNQAGPQADFTFHPNPITINNAQVTFSSETTGATSWLWNFGDGTGTFSGDFVTHTYSSVGNYEVTLVVTDIYGCPDTITQEVVVNDVFSIYIPNSFTPDGDGLNDVFQAYGLSWEDGKYEMNIYNRWGNIVYHTTDPNQPWNGGLNNNPDRSLLIPDVYVYYIKVKGLNYRDMVYTGSVTLLK
jgi:gliding motility-associated-like protein